jgi:hypothetical protein
MTVASRFLRVGAALIAIASCHAIADDVYKTVDAQGNVVYSDHAIAPTSRKLNVDVIQGNAEDAARLAKQRALTNADEAQQAKLAQQQAAQQQQQQAQEAQRKRKCDAARNRYGIFAAGGRIFKTDEQGNRVYYSDVEIESQRVSAKAAMDAACSQ